MERPIAIKLNTAAIATVHSVAVDTAAAASFPQISSATRPAIIVARKAAILQEMSAGMVDAADVLAVSDGNWSDALLVILNTGYPERTEEVTAKAGDSAFLDAVRRDAPHLLKLAEITLSAIRGAGVSGELAEARAGRWINRPINTFTLKPQTRAQNLQFTLYGDPRSYDSGDFLLPDQNSYSRGWVRSVEDAQRLAVLAKIAHERRAR